MNTTIHSYYQIKFAERPPRVTESMLVQMHANFFGLLHCVSRVSPEQFLAVHSSIPKLIQEHGKWIWRAEIECSSGIDALLKEFVTLLHAGGLDASRGWRGGEEERIST